MEQKRYCAAYWKRGWIPFSAILEERSCLFMMHYTITWIASDTYYHAMNKVGYMQLRGMPESLGE
jgi:hypothetical protein